MAKQTPAKQIPPTRLDAHETLRAAGLEPKPQTPVPVAGPENEIGEPVDTRPGGRPAKSDEKKATEKVTAYFTPEQYDKIEELQRAHRKKTKKRISVNELLRRLVINASIEDIIR